MTEYQVGEIVDITLRGVRVSDTSRLGHSELRGSYECDLGQFDVTVPIGPPTVEIRRVRPAEPVAAGDVWLDSHGCRWFAVETGDRFGNTKIQLTRTGGNTASVSSVHQDCVLVTRLFSGATSEEEA